MKFLKFAIALLLLPALAACGRFAWFSACYSLSQGQVPWMTLTCLGLGFSTMASAYLALPRWNWLYVFGHETTHALAVLMSGGRVSGFKVASHGGHVETDTLSVWIALSPYIFPFYPAVAGVLWLALRYWLPVVSEWEWIFLLLWGASWGFHFCFTASLLKTEQSDFASQGRLFSLVIILLANLLMLSALLWMWRAPEQWQLALDTLWNYTSGSYHFCILKTAALYRLAF